MYPEDPHPVRKLEPGRRRDYLLAVAAMVYADGRIDDLELQVLRRLGRVIELDEPAVDEIVAMTTRLDPDRAKVASIVASFARDEMRFPLLADAILVSFVDHRVAAAEAKEISEYARVLGIDDSQAVLMARYVEEVLIQNESGELSRALDLGLADAAASPSPQRGVKWLFRKLTES